MLSEFKRQEKKLIEIDVNGEGVHQKEVTIMDSISIDDGANVMCH